MAATVPQTLFIRAGELRLYDFDFTQQAEIQAGQTVASVTSLTYTAPGGGSITISNDNAQHNAIPPNAPVISGNQVQFWIGAVTNAPPGTVFNLTCTIVTSGGAVIVEEGVLQVIS